MRRPDLPKEQTVNLKIPENTCPDIDQIIKLLEDLREDNSTLRQLGREWHEIAESYYGVLEDMDSYIDDLEEKIEDLEEKIEELENN